MRFRLMVPFLLCSLLAGCEIFAGFDRDRIRPDEPDVTTLLTGDGQVLGGGRDAAALDGGLFDGSAMQPEDEDGAADDATVDDDASVDLDAALGDAGQEPDAGVLDASDLDAADPDAALDGAVTDGAVDPDAAADAS